MGANRKISELNAITAWADSDVFTIVKNGVNVKMTKANLVAGLGVTGSIVQDGASTGTPVLDTQGTVNNIRNIEDGKGILSSVSAENGLTLEHNFTQDATGTPIVSDINDASPTFRSLVEGEGVDITVSGDAITIEFEGIPSDVVVVNEKADLPAAVSGTITLSDDTAYLISGDIDLGTDNLAPGDNCVVYGTDSAVGSLTYSGTDPMFEGDTENFKITKLTLSCASQQLFALSSLSGNGVFQFVNSTVSACGTVGTVADMQAFQLTDVAFNSVTVDGLTFQGAFAVFVGTRNTFAITAGTMFDLGTATFSAGWTLESCFANLGAGTYFLDGLASSGNIGSDALGTLFNTRFSGTGTPLNTVTVNDSRWQFFGNDAIQDSRADGLLSLNSNVTETVITVASTPVLIAGTWVVERESQFTGTTGGRLTYNGVKDVALPIDGSFTAAPVSGVNKAFTFHLYKNGVDVGNADQPNQGDAGDKVNTSLKWQLTLQTGDYLECYVSNDTDTVNLLVEKAIFRIN
jgi:hypothetical protein